MDFLGNLALGFSVALTPFNLLMAVAGVTLGILIGALPGVGPPSGVALLLPLTFGMDPTSGIIMLAALYAGTMYGGTITSVLINTPGESASVVTCLDGHQMALQGRAGPALGIAAFIRRGYRRRGAADAGVAGAGAGRSRSARPRPSR
jgi:putative tricarboxylic transport membrane protein